MKLSLELISDHLPDDFDAQVLGSSPCDAVLGRPQIYYGEGPMEAGKLYVTRCDLLPPASQAHGAAVVCTGGGAPEGWLSGGRNVLHVLRPGDFLEVFNAVGTVFDLFDEWEAEMRDELEREDGFDYYKVAEAGARMLGNAVGMSDRYLRVVFTSDTSVDTSGERHVGTSEDAYSNIALGTGAQMQEHSIAEQKLREPFFSSFSEPGISDVYCCNLFPFGHFFGCCFVYPNDHPLLASELAVADTFFSYFEKALVKHLRVTSARESPTAKVARNLLTGMPLSRDDRNLLALGENEKWAFFVLGKARNARSMPKDYMNAVMGSLLPRSIFAALVDDEVMGVIKVQDGASITNSPAVETLDALLEGMGYVVGLSNAFSDLSNIGEHRLQAAWALRSKTFENRERAVVRPFTSCTLDFMLSACCTSVSLESLFSEQLHSLMNYDDTHDGIYVETLESYLRNESNVTATANELCVHRSTLIKRLDRIKRILETDLANPNLNLYYRMCLELLRRKKD